ncbi:hypothetical protein ACVDFE_09015 [Lentzea chajnantorensis]
MSGVPEVHVDWYLGRSPLPDVDDEGIALAARNPGGQVGYYDLHQPREKRDDTRTLKGLREVGPDGAFTGEEWRNPGFVPHPDTAGTRFHTDFELELWRTINGFVRLGPFARAFAEAELMAMCDEGEELVLRPNEHGDRTLDVCTSFVRVPSTWPHWTSVRGIDLIRHLGHGRHHVGLQLNRSSKPKLRIPVQTLAELHRAESERVNDLMRVGPLPATPTPMGTAMPGGQQ